MNFPFGTNGKFTILGTPVLKHIRVYLKRPILFNIFQLQGGGDMSLLKNFNTAAVRQGFIIDDVSGRLPDQNGYLISALPWSGNVIWKKKYFLGLGKI